MKKKVNLFVNQLLREIKKRERYYDKKTENWKQTLTAEKYQYQTDMLNDLYESILSSRSYNEFFN